MFVDDVMKSILQSLHGADGFLQTLARGDGFDTDSFERFIDEFRRCRELFVKLPRHVRQLLSSVVEIPMLMQNSERIVDEKDRDWFNAKTIEFQDLLIDMLSDSHDADDVGFRIISSSDYRALVRYTKEGVYHEQDTIERLIVPILKEMGWAIDDIESRQLVRGSRSNCDNRNFDLNLYKNVDDGCLSLAIECKCIGTAFLRPDDEVIKIAGHYKNALFKFSDNNGLGQLLGDYLDANFRDVAKDDEIIDGATVAVWTNGAKWVVVKRNRGASGFNMPHGVQKVPAQLVDMVKFCKRNDNAIQRDWIFEYVEFDLFDSNGCLVENTFDKLFAEISESAMLCCPYRR